MTDKDEMHYIIAVRSDISPVILAAHLNQFEILQMLLRKDATIEKPHRYSCICEACDQERFVSYFLAKERMKNLLTRLLMIFRFKLMRLQTVQF